MTGTIAKLCYNNPLHLELCLKIKSKTCQNKTLRLKRPVSVQNAFLTRLKQKHFFKMYMQSTKHNNKHLNLNQKFLDVTVRRIYFKRNAI